MSDSALQEAQDIFGVDFDYAEFEDYVEEDDEEEEEVQRHLFTFDNRLENTPTVPFLENFHI